jgi:hypothetical protein
MITCLLSDNLFFFVTADQYQPSTSVVASILPKDGAISLRTCVRKKIGFSYKFTCVG